MNQALFLSELRKIVLVVIAYATGKGWLSAVDSSLLGGLVVPVGLLIGPWLWGTYTLINSKIVPQNTLAIDTTFKPSNADKITAHVTTAEGEKVSGKILALLMVAIMLPWLAIDSVHAQTPRVARSTPNVNLDPLGVFNKPAPTATTGATTLDASLKSFGDNVQTIEKSVVDKAIADLNAAITDATNHNDNISLPCWKANLALVQGLPSQWPEPPTLPLGIALSIQIQRDLINSITGNDVTSLKVACAALLGDQLKIVANVAALLGIRVATGGLF